MKKSQKERIINRLLQKGEISRNECLQVFISRLSSYINILESEGWRFETERRGGNYKTEADYVYKVTFCPIEKAEYINPITKEIITRYLTTS